MIFHIPTLQNIDLSQNELLSGSLPPFTHNGSLRSIRLSATNFSGSIPSSVSNLKTLLEIDLYSCKFTGSIPSTFANLTQLTYIDLSYNSFSGNIPHSLFTLPSLLVLRLGGNQFTGQVEAFSIVNVSKIVTLDLSGNQMEGPFPDSLFQLESLETLYLSDNLFTGTFLLEKIQRYVNLRNLDPSGNNLRVDATNHNSSSYAFPRLYLRLASCNIYDFPEFVKHSESMTVLDLSNNRISGEIPSWIWGLTQLHHLNLSFNLLTGVQKPYHILSSLYSLDLRSNQLRGELNLLTTPNITSDLVYLLLSNNNLSGSIPISLCTATYLVILDLSDNKLSGSIPSCLIAMSRLGVIDLGQNNISGAIPDTFSPYCGLQYFDLNNNTLQGKIPSSLKNCKGLEFMNVGNNFINDIFPCMLPSSLRVLALHSNSFHGEVMSCHNSWPDLQILDISSNHFSGSLETINLSSWKGMVQGSDSQLRHQNSQGSYYALFRSGVTLIMKGLQVELYKIWSDFSSIDLSCNNFKGEIPNVIGDLSLLHHLNLSHNALNGSIPKSFGKLRELESLDLSQNQLTGAIPMEVARLSFLSFLNLSYNMLVGEIPNDPHFQTLSADSFKGNPGLCGFNLDISCSSHTDDDESDLSHEKVEEKIEWEYVSAALGYVVGLGSIVWLLVFCRSFRKKYLDKIDDVVQEMFDARDMRSRRRATARRRAVRRQ